MSCASCLHDISHHAPTGCTATVDTPATGLIPVASRACGCMHYRSRLGTDQCDICGSFLSLERFQGLAGTVRFNHTQTDCAERVRKTFATLNAQLTQVTNELNLERANRRQREDDRRRHHEINLAGDMSPRWALWLVERLLADPWTLEVLYGPRQALYLTLPLDDPPPPTLPPLNELSERAMLACVHVATPLCSHGTLAPLDYRGPRPTHVTCALCHTQIEITCHRPKCKRSMIHVGPCEIEMGRS